MSKKGAGSNCKANDCKLARASALAAEVLARGTKRSCLSSARTQWTKRDGSGRQADMVTQILGRLTSIQGRSM